MKRILFYLLTISTIPVFSQQAIIADHSSVNIDDIPNEYIEKVKKMYLNYMGESHARGVLYGFQLLENENTKFSVEVTFEDKAPANTNELCVSRTYKSKYSHFNELFGEQHFWTNAEGRNLISSHLEYMNGEIHDTVDAMGFGWCWDLTWHNSPQGDPDPILDVRWAGASEGGIDGDLSWGIDYEDSLQTNNTVCLQDYFKAVDEYNTNHPSTITFFTTGPVDKYDGESGYQRYLKHEAIRDYVNENGGYLFDYADILNWHGDTLHTTEWNNIQYPIGDPELATGGNGYDAGYGGCHISQEACLKLAKGMWWLLARMAGWNNSQQTGIYNNNNDNNTAVFFPNPSNGTVNISLPGISDFEVYNLQGQLLAKYTQLNEGSQLDISDLPNGLFMLKVVNNGKLYVNQLLVNN